MNDVALHSDLASLTDENWQAYETAIAEPSRRPARSFGEYAVASRKRRCPVSRNQTAAAGEIYPNLTQP